MIPTARTNSSLASSIFPGFFALSLAYGSGACSPRQEPSAQQSVAPEPPTHKPSASFPVRRDGVWTLLPPQSLEPAFKTASAPWVLVNVWASWCEPCVAEIPMLLRVAERFAPTLALFLINADMQRARPEAAELLKKLRVARPWYAKDGKEGAFIDTLDRRWGGTLPATFLIRRRDAKRQRFWNRPLHAEELVATLEAAGLGRASARGKR